jgi:ornithine decarboxylase
MAKYGLRFAGVSFHIGSASQNPVQFTRAIERAREFQAVAGRPFEVMDIGGGFLPDAMKFEGAATAIRQARVDWERAGNCPRTWIAEPGRYFSAYSTGLLVPIIAKKRGPSGVGWRYVLAESLYGQFSCIPFDHATPHWELVGDVREPSEEPAHFFGRTCDSLDLIAHAVDSPVYEVGDVLWFPGMGAYTNASASEFNGFAVPEAVYLEDALPTEVEHVMPGVTFPISTVSELKLCV